MNEIITAMHTERIANPILPNLNSVSNTGKDQEPLSCNQIPKFASQMSMGAVIVYAKIATTGSTTTTVRAIAKPLLAIKGVKVRIKFFQ